jgi:hypothetical protein
MSIDYISMTCRYYYRSGFTTLSLALLRVARCGSLLERAKIAQTLAMEEHGGHENLRGSGRRSVIPYVHGRVCCIDVRVCAVQAVS